MMKRAKHKRHGNTSDAGRVAELICEIQDAFGSALSFGRALELMGLGLRSLDDTDHSRAFVTVAETIMRHLDEAKTLCAEVLSESGRP